MLEILRTGFSRSVNAACSGMLVQGGYIQKFSCNKYTYHASLLFKCIIVKTQGWFLWRIYHAPSTEMKSLTCINSKIIVDSVFTHLD